MERTISTLDPDVKISVNGTIPTDVGTEINKVTDLFKIAQIKPKSLSVYIDKRLYTDNGQPTHDAVYVQSVKMI